MSEQNETRVFDDEVLNAVWINGRHPLQFMFAPYLTMFGQNQMANMAQAYMDATNQMLELFKPKV